MIFVRLGSPSFVLRPSTNRHLLNRFTSLPLRVTDHLRLVFEQCDILLDP
jgi:hypothetical protein